MKEEDKNNIFWHLLRVGKVLTNVAQNINNKVICNAKASFIHTQFELTAEQQGSLFHYTNIDQLSWLRKYWQIFIQLLVLNAFPAHTWQIPLWKKHYVNEMN